MNNPEILWAQNKNKVFITINIPNISNEWVEIKEDKIEFRGENGENKYNLCIELLNTIDTIKSLWVTKGNGIFITLEKNPIKSWIKLTSKKYNNLKIDWNRWEDTDDELNVDQENLLQDFSDFKKTLPSELMDTDFTELFNKDLNTQISDNDSLSSEDNESEKLEKENEILNKMEEGDLDNNIGL